MNFTLSVVLKIDWGAGLPTGPWQELWFCMNIVTWRSKAVVQSRVLDTILKCLMEHGLQEEVEEEEEEEEEE